MKRILHVLAQIPGQTGSGTFLQALIKEAGKKGYRQALLAGVPEGYPEDQFLVDWNVEYYPVWFETEELPFPVVGMSDAMPYPSTRYRDMTEEMADQWKAAFRKRVSEAILGFQPDQILCHHLWLLSALVREIAPDLPVAVISHGTDLRQLDQAHQFAEEVICGCGGADVVFALNVHQKDKIVERFGLCGNRIQIIGGGYHSDLFYPVERTGARRPVRLVYAGKLSSAKGVPSLLRAFSQLEPESCTLTLAGSGVGKEAEEIRALADAITGQITFTGPLPQERLADLFRDSDLFVLASFYEGLPLVLIEALATGLRAVVSDLPGVAEWLGQEICECGLVEFVSLPTLREMDKPEEKELPAFEERLRKTIEIQIQRIQSGELLDHHRIQNNIRKASWESIFHEIEESFSQCGAAWNSAEEKGRKG